MTIHEIAQKTGLTKKAINYYEQKGLIAPEYNPENGYRVFSEQDLKKLAIISLLRQLEIPVEKIRPLLEDKVAMTDLLKQRLQTIATEVESLETEKQILAAALEKEQRMPLAAAAPEDIIALKDEIALNHFKRQNVIRSQWQRIFPDTLGRLFSLIYGANLIEPIDTPEKREAWAALVEHFDEIEEVDVPEEIRNILDSQSFQAHLRDLESNYGAAILHFGSLDNKQVEEELPAPPVDGIEPSPEKVELVRGLLNISAFVRDELGERLAPLKKHLVVLSNSYNRAQKNLSLVNDVLHERAEYQPVLDLFNRLRNEAKSR